MSAVNYLGLRHMNHGLTLIVSFFSFVQTSFREFGEVGLGFGWVHLGYIRFSEKLVRVLGWEETLPWACRCNKPHSAICIVLLSEFVSQNVWLQQNHKPWDVFVAQKPYLHGESSRLPLLTLNSYNATCQLHLSKTGGENVTGKLNC